MLADGVGIHLLDWGGAGTPLVFITGIGHSAHVFDDLAPRFTDAHRVVALTRVGYGDSDQPEGRGYDLASRRRQLLAVLDSLGFGRVVLVGHSLGGQELTDFARAHPERVAALVYLDAAYDQKRSIGMRNELGPFQARMPMPTPDDLASAEAWRQWQARTLGVLVPHGEALAITVRDSSGRVVAMRVAARVTQATLAAVEPMRWDGVRAPALAIYADWDTVAESMPWLRDDPAALAEATAIMRRTYRAMLLEERVRFAREVPTGRVETIRGGHYFPLMQADETERRVRAFLTETGLEPDREASR